MVTYFLYGLFVLACLVLILAVLLQPGKADAGALFTSSVSSAAFGPRGTQTLLAKITIGAAAAFMLIALTLSVGVGSRRSVLEAVPEEPAPQQSPQPAASPVASPQTNGSTTDAPQGSGVPAATAPAANANVSTATPAPAGSPEGQTSP